MATSNTPVALPELLPQTKAALAAVAACPQVKAGIAAIKADAELTLADQIAITEIEAPPFHETERGKDMMRRFRELGLTDVTMDEVGNVIAHRPGAGNGPRLILAGHQDTVFPAGTDVKVRKEGTRYLAPGISDDALGLAVILEVLRTLQAQGIRTVGDITFVASVGEEGNGDLRGTKHLFASGLAVDGFISVDGANVHRVLRAATGSKRYRVHFDGPGGHSWKAFGNASAIQAMGRAIAKIADVVPCGDPKTTFTCGTIKGGTTVNSIAAHCEMELDMRSAGAAELVEVEKQIIPLIEAACREENERWGVTGDKAVKLTLEPIGHRPGGQQSDDSPVLQAARAAMGELGIALTSYDAASTDQNIAINKGIPATTLGGGGLEGNNHDVREWYDPVDAHQGPQLAFLTALVLAGVEGVSEPLLPKRA
ncbi:MAG: M20/M25/M40 family metallo-hydrolase [Duodenibacillus sp.]|nr:M20/M25/M40 family metallo-hydrolase [Duodenibacillus sp.]